MIDGITFLRAEWKRIYRKTNLIQLSTWNTLGKCPEKVLIEHWSVYLFICKYGEKVEIKYLSPYQATTKKELAILWNVLPTYFHIREILGTFNPSIGLVLKARDYKQVDYATCQQWATWVYSSIAPNWVFFFLLHPKTVPLLCSSGPPDSFCSTPKSFFSLFLSIALTLRRRFEEQ